MGAQPTDTAWRLLSMVGIVPKKEFGPKKEQGTKTLTTSFAQVR